MMSVVVEGPDGERELLTKGAPEAVFAKCTHFESDGEIFPMEPILVGDLLEEVNELSEDGFRVLAVATKKVEKRAAYSKADEGDLVLTGYLAFLDPPKETAAKAISGAAPARRHRESADRRQRSCHAQGLHRSRSQCAKKSCWAVPGRKACPIPSYPRRWNEVNVFARLSPAHKQRIVKALQEKGHTVGFMGDGINDAPALRAADVGVSVDNAVDIAKESADMILLEKSLMVLEEGVLEGRKVFVNILKYIRMGASSNFGNMFSVIGASAWLPFVPMAPIQVLTNNLLYDFSQVPIPTDNVGPQQISKAAAMEHR